MPNSYEFQPRVCYNLTATIASGQSTSAAVDLSDCELLGVFLPSTFDGTAIKFQAATSADSTFVTVENGAASPADVTLTASAHSKYVPLAAADRNALRGVRHLKLVSSSSQSTTDTIITLAVRPL